ncbi:glycosyltransferase family 2 protein [Kineococcus sp. SYSU DK004]|uniref:glycosyltransferase n=1 Tax=Kineococcus sp. SYSU DK004 TaxID=3383125 RepID=UPI003D7E20E9
MSAPADLRGAGEDTAADPRPGATGRAWPSVTVVVPVHGDRGSLLLTARALAAQDYPGAVDVVIADNGDNRDLQGALDALEVVSLVRETTPGSYAARNAALLGARGDVIAFTDSDCVPTAHWLREAVGALLAAEEAGTGPCFVGGGVRLFCADPARPTAAELWDSLNFLRQERYVTVEGWAATANMVVRRSTLDAVGAFDERLKSGGDREWGERASRAGVRALWCPAAEVAHPARRRMAELHGKARRVTRGDVETRRRDGRPAFDPGVLRASLNPALRSTVRRSGDLEVPSPRNRARYVAVTLWMRYYLLGAKALHAVRTAR